MTRHPRHRLSRTCRRVLLAAGLLLPAAAGQAQIADRLDRNGDGFMDQQEAQQSALEKFSALDADRNGALSPPEMNMPAGAENPLDANGDGMVGFDEYWRYFADIYGAADVDRDGRLSPAELQAMRQGSR